MAKYSQEFKLKVVQHFLSSSNGHKRTASLFNIHHSQVQRWVALFELNGEKCFFLCAGDIKKRAKR